MTWNVLIPDRLRGPADVEDAVFGGDATFVTPGARDERDVPESCWRNADAILAWHDVTLHADIIAKLDRCRVIVRVGAGYDNVDLKSAAARGIRVCNVPDYGTNDVADHAMGLLLALSRGLVQYDAAARSGRWAWDVAGPLRRVTDRTLGIIGLGRIGTATALRAKAFGMRVAYYDPYKDAGYDKALGLRQVRRLQELLSASDAVSLHVPLTDETRGMADDRFFAECRPEAIFINTARGACHDLDALHEALRSGHVRAAGLDVLPQEPPDPEHPLVRAWRMQETWLAGRLLITPHAAFYNRESYEEMRRKAAEEALRVLQGHEPLHCVNSQWVRSAGQ